jgi:nucleoside-diphosphate-sugar epimerase
MKIAVTGASGFIGRHVTRALVEAGHDPVILLRPSSVVPPDMESLTCVRHDLGSQTDGVFQKLGSPDLLIHLAWGGLPNYRSLHHLATELPAQFQFLRAMVEAGLPKLVVTGTCFEYGMHHGPLDEKTVAQPANPYGFAKFALLNMLGMLARETPFDLTWARLFYLFGQGQAESSLYRQLHRAAAAGDAVFPMSGGEQLRDFMPIGQFRDEFVRLSLAPGGHGIVNVCCGSPVSVRSLVEQLIEENGWNIRPELGRYPYPDYEPMAFWGIRKKLEGILDQEKYFRLEFPRNS